MLKKLLSLIVARSILAIGTIGWLKLSQPAQAATAEQVQTVSDEIQFAPVPQAVSRLLCRLEHS